MVGVDVVALLGDNSACLVIAVFDREKLADPFAMMR
jgi:hypothetical protein